MPDLDINVFLKIFSSWQVIAVTLLMLVLFPLIFYMASFGKAPAQFKKKVIKKKIEVKQPSVIKPKEAARKEEREERDTDEEKADN